MLNKLKENRKLAELSYKVDNEGNNFLHLAILNYKAIGFEHFKTIIDILGEDILVDLLHVSNNDIYAPMEIADKISDESKRAPLLRLLLPFAIKSSNKYLSNKEELEKISSNKLNTKLDENLKKADDAINYSNSIIHSSSTHPYSNSLDDGDNKNIEKKVYQSRKKLFLNGLQLISKHLPIIEASQVGNCEEFAILTAKFLTSTMPNYSFTTLHYNSHVFQVYGLSENYNINKPQTWGPNAALTYNGEFIDKPNQDFSWVNFNKDGAFYSFYGQKQQLLDKPIDTWDEETTLIEMGVPPYSIEKVGFENGDHVFTIIDRNRNSDINQPSTYGSQAVIVDGWAKKRYPATKANENLKDYYKIVLDGRTYKFIKSYNEKYHKISINAMYLEKDFQMIWGDPDKPRSDIRKPISLNQEMKKSIDDSSFDKKENLDNKTESEKYKSKAIKPKYIVAAGSDLIQTSTSLLETLDSIIELSKAPDSSEPITSNQVEINSSIAQVTNPFKFWQQPSEQAAEELSIFSHKF